MFYDDNSNTRLLGYGFIFAFSSFFFSWLFFFGHLAILDRTCGGLLTWYDFWSVFFFKGVVFLVFGGFG